MKTPPPSLSGGANSAEGGDDLSIENLSPADAFANRNSLSVRHDKR